MQAMADRGEHNFKLVMVVNGSLITGGGKKRLMKEGKMAAQCCHAAVACCEEAILGSDLQCFAWYQAWNQTGTAKIVTKSKPSKSWLMSRRPPPEPKVEEPKESTVAESSAANTADDQPVAKKQKRKKKRRKQMAPEVRSKIFMFEFEIDRFRARKRRQILPIYCSWRYLY